MVTISTQLAFTNDLPRKILHQEDYFDEGEYLLADLAYASSEVVVPAYWFSTCTTEEKITFNTKLAKSQALLRELQNQLRFKDEMESSIKWVVACIILHNMLANIGDVWEDVFMDDETPETHNTSTDGNTHSTIQM
ncbi:hypothetical protein BY996DRAFT_6546489 [Phakopsora pachyrhizi]|uniref:DDE Tnp4 domain-containing protein n=1 Tax=Phakopsora pachyrhizi TaxID=170000 RepID=A0AAV0BTR5_PHAPC|nr:hypothetical protein BY996DRAFT_6546489 [Phakopsora pachyrhizi]CAH7690202.1 hypothetical protein PPACK8108_LOCUS25474 [Phakopsora pachyrhizi]